LLHSTLIPESKSVSGCSKPDTDLVSAAAVHLMQDRRNCDADCNIYDTEQTCIALGLEHRQAAPFVQTLSDQIRQDPSVSGTETVFFVAHNPGNTGFEFPL